MISRAGLVVAVALLAPACASVGGGRIHDLRPHPADVAHLPPESPLRSGTLEGADPWLRHYAMAGRLDSLTLAFEDGSPLRPRDDLQRALQQGLALHEAGEYAASNDVFEIAELEADRRYTRSVSQRGLSMLTSDRAVDYTPSRAELAMIPYYRMMNYVRLGDVDAAVVEARKASARMAELESATGDVCRSSTFLKHLTGLVYEMAGELNDAVVALRQAEHGYDECTDEYGFGAPDGFGADLHRVASRAGLGDVADEARERYAVERALTPGPDSGAGEVVLLLENGFVAHRASQNLYFPIFDADVEDVDTSEPLELLGLTAVLTARVVENLMERRLWGVAVDDYPEIQLAHALSGAYVMKLSWPVHRLEANAAPALRVVAGEAVAQAAPVQDVSAEVVRDFEVGRKLVIGRTIARGVLKYVAARSLERKAEERNAFLGFITGAAANAAGNSLERADTRSWSLLPDRISIARLRLPAGEHTLAVQVLDAHGSVIRTVDLGEVAVRAGERVILSQRVWGDAAGDRTRLASATRGVVYQEIASEAPVAEPASADTVASDAPARDHPVPR